MSAHEIVIIGASFAGLTAAQGLLKDVLPKVKGERPFKVVQIAPNDEFYWKVGAPRLIVNPTSLPLEKALLPIAPHFKTYSKEQYEFVQAYVTSIDPATQTVHTSTSASFHYDSLVIASGTSLATSLWSVTDGSEPLKAALDQIHKALPGAQTVLVAGGGPAGIETAGELGEVYGKTKDITLLSGSTRLLSKLQSQKMGQDAQARLEKQGVKVVNDNVRVVEHSTADGKHVVKLSNGESKTVDVYIEATGDKPNSKFVPAAWLDDHQRVKNDPQTLRLDVPGVTGVYVYGSVGSYSDGSLFDVLFAKPAILATLLADLQGQAPGPRSNNVYKKTPKDMQFVPIGSQQGVGIAFGWKIPSFVVRMAKAKDFMIGNAVKYIEGTA